MAFDTDLNPVPLDFTATQFTVPFTGFTYILNGTPTGLTPEEIIFYKASEGGGFVVDMTVVDQFSFIAPQMYSGLPWRPTMLYGTFTAVADDLDYLMVDGNFVGTLAGTTLKATPEPGTIVLAGCGVLGLLAVRRRTRPSADRN